jgi:predicted transposase YbfD/YdcC
MEYTEIFKAIIAVLLLIAAFGACLMLADIRDTTRDIQDKLEDMEGYTSSMSKTINNMSEQLASIYGLAKHLHPEADAKARETKSRIVRAMMKALTDVFKRR